MKYKYFDKKSALYIFVVEYLISVTDSDSGAAMHFRLTQKTNKQTI